MSALLFGSISSLADTSELQRESFNRAFAEHGLDWRWDRADYQMMLTGNGGADRITAYAADRGEDVDAAAVHATKSRFFQEGLAAGGISTRPGVVTTIATAHARGMKVALVTTTSPENVAALLDALPDVGTEDFELVVDATQVGSGKPDPEAYDLAVRTLLEEPGSCVAVEDNAGGVRSAVAAGVRCVAFPNANTAGHVFTGAALLTDSLDLDQVLGSAA